MSQWDISRKSLGFASVGSQLVCHRQTLTPRKGFPIEWERSGHSTMPLIPKRRAGRVNCYH